MGTKKDGSRTDILITDILADKKLFWKYILGSLDDYCKTKKIEKVEVQSIDEVIEEIENPQNEMQKKLALLKQKAKSSQTVETEDIPTDEIDEELVEKKYNSIINQLIDNVAIWQKKNYDIVGYEENGECIIEFKKVDENVYRSQGKIRTDIIKYCNSTEILTGSMYINDVKYDKEIGAVETILMSEWIKLVNDDAKNFCKVQYGI